VGSSGLGFVGVLSRKHQWEVRGWKSEIQTFSPPRDPLLQGAVGHWLHPPLWVTLLSASFTTGFPAPSNKDQALLSCGTLSSSLGLPTFSQSLYKFSLP
jgi:hypothetical protein